LTVCWSALLYAGADAALSHTTAGALWQLLPGPVGPPVHVTVPVNRAPRSRHGLIVHRTRLALAVTGSPPRTSVATTILALCSPPGRPGDVTAVLGRAAQRYPGALREARDEVLRRPTFRRRNDFLAAADDALGGAHSALERLYLVDVERAHGLPNGERQRSVDGTHEDVYYREFRTIAELDGRVHRLADIGWRDMARDNASVVRGEVTLRFGWADVRHRPCAVAGQVAAVLRTRGWTGRPVGCRPGCAVERARFGPL
jgi:very-short-patch-repair endonuclease